jgi:hypothetical protein
MPWPGSLPLLLLPAARYVRYLECRWCELSPPSPCYFHSCSIGVSAVNVVQARGTTVVANFVVDRSPPSAVLFVQGRSDAVVLASPLVSVVIVASDELSAANMTAWLQRRDSSGGTFVVNGSLPLSLRVNGSRTVTTNLSLADGVHVIEARAKDGVGNVGEFVAVAVTVDTVAPRVAPWQPRLFTPEDVASVCVSVVDAAPSACTVALVAVVSGAPVSILLAVNDSASEAGAAVFCGSVSLGAFQGNVTLNVTATDPAGNRASVNFWVVRDSVVPVHTAALVPGVGAGACVFGRVVSCASASRVAFSGGCGSGGPTVTPAAPCAVEWAVVAVETLQLGVCGTTAGTSGAAVVPAGGWVRLQPGSFMVNASAAVSAAVAVAGGDRLAVKVAVLTRALDAAGARL